MILIKRVQLKFRSRKLLPAAGIGFPIVAKDQSELAAINKQLKWLVSGDENRTLKKGGSQQMIIDRDALASISVTEVREVQSPAKSRSAGRQDPLNAAAARLHVKVEDLNDILAQLTLADFRRLQKSATGKRPVPSRDRVKPLSPRSAPRSALSLVENSKKGTTM